MGGWATFSPTRRYRYTLGRAWGDGPTMVWLMLNPSTADAYVLDNTVRRCVNFAKRTGCGGITVLNLYALRATQPDSLLAVDDPEGEGNLDAWRSVLTGFTGPVVAAWGAFPHPGTSRALEWFGPESLRWLCLGRTKAGHPLHPLYIRGDAPLVPLYAGVAL